MSTRTTRYDVPALLMVGLFGFAIGLSLPERAAENRSDLKRPVLSDEAAEYRERYGPPRYSSHDEELFVRDFFSDKRDGFFVDVGASDARIRSNTYYLEKELNWSGIAVDPIEEFAVGYKQYRTRTRFFAMFRI